jgi:PAS domain S-box-containing protein
MSRTLRLLILEDNEDDALLLIRVIQNEGYTVQYDRIDSAAAMETAVSGREYDAVISDYSMPQFTAPDALRIVQAHGIDVPFIVVSGTIGEELAVAMMHAGAHDYLMKNNLARLVPALERELHEAEERRKKYQMEQSLRESEERFRRLADTCPVLIWIAGVKRHAFYFNKRWLDFTGRSASQEYGQGWMEDVHPNDRNALSQVYEAAFESRRPYSFEYRLNNVDGTYHWVLESGVPRLEPDGNFTGFIGSCTDVTDRRQAEESIREREKKYHDLANFLPQVLFETNLEGQLTFLNAKGYELSGYQPRDLANGKSAFDLLMPADRDRARANFKRIMEGEHIGGVEYRAVVKDGTPLPLLVESTTILERGVLKGLRGVGVDMTSQKQIEQEIRNLSQAIECSPDGVVMLDVDGVMVYVNPSAIELLDYQRKEDLIGHSFYEFTDVDGACALREQGLTSRARGEWWRGEHVLIRRDGERIMVEFVCSMIPDDRGLPCRYVANIRRHEAEPDLPGDAGVHTGTHSTRP